MSEERIGLRELGLRLTLFNPYRRSKSRGRTELLGILSSGKLMAYFDFPSNRFPRIRIPAEHWRKLKHGVFRASLSTTGTTRGDYVVSPSIFANEYLDWFLQNCRVSDDVSELASALRERRKKAEVYVLEQDWQAFSAQEGIDTSQHSEQSQKSSRGITENPNWSAILIEVAVELLNASRDSRPLTKTIAGKAMARVPPRQNSKLPKTETVEKKVDEIINRTWHRS